MNYIERTKYSYASLTEAFHRMLKINEYEKKNFSTTPRD